MQCGYAGQKDDSRFGGMIGRAVRFHHATQNGHSLTYELFIPGISPLIFLYSVDWGN